MFTNFLGLTLICIEVFVPDSRLLQVFLSTLLDIIIPYTINFNFLGNDVTRCVGYGHIGDGNMHLNITTPQYSQEVMDKIEPYLYEFTSQHRSAIKIFIKIFKIFKICIY